MTIDKFSTECRECERLDVFLQENRSKYPTYFNKPVPSFGDPEARLLVVGLAPGLHGANASGRPFTGDHAGILLYETLYAFGFATQPASQHADDNLRLVNCRITNSVRCVPPQNKPITAEIKQCNRYLRAELDLLPVQSVILCLGGVAHQAVLRAYQLKLSQYKFGHGAFHQLDNGHHLLDSYHCSRYNTQTRRLTPELFHAVFQHAKDLLS